MLRNVNRLQSAAGLSLNQHRSYPYISLQGGVLRWVFGVERLPSSPMKYWRGDIIIFMGSRFDAACNHTFDNIHDTRPAVVLSCRATACTLDCYKNATCEECLYS